MDATTLNAVCRAFALGAARGEPRPVAGGLTHRMWRVETQRGVWAVKVLNRDRQDPRFTAWFARAFALERAAYAAGVSMPRPVPVAATGGCFAELAEGSSAGVTVRAHAWVDGDQLDNDHVYPSEDVERIAAMLTQIHALQMRTEVLASEALHVFGDDAWRAYADRADAAQEPWASAYRSLLPVLSELDAYLAAAHLDRTPLIISHRDADKKNILRTPDGVLLLVDWDGAGPVNPRHDLAACALVWAGVRSGDPDPALARTFVDSYRRAGGGDAPFQRTDLAELVSQQLGWFRFNVRRALGEHLRDDRDVATGVGEIRWNTRQLPRFARSIDAWLSVLQD